MTSSRDRWAQAQRAMAARGWYNLAVDGKPGDGTLAGVEAALARIAAVEAVMGIPDPMKADDDPETTILLRELECDEGRRLHAYQDHLGWWTIGIGRLIDKRKGGGISDAEADYLKRNDIAKVRAGLDAQLPWWRDLDPVRQRALQNMAFQMGVGGLAKFKTSLAHIKAQSWNAAAQSLEKSLWAKQTPERAARVIAMIKTGKAA